jgi:hypothetical protein
LVCEVWFLLCAAGATISADELADYPPVFRDAGSSRVARAQDILLFLQSPQMEVERYRVRVSAAGSAVGQRRGNQC